jgi:hypothetical protein
MKPKKAYPDVRKLRLNMKLKRPVISNWPVTRRRGASRLKNCFRRLLVKERLAS